MDCPSSPREKILTEALTLSAQTHELSTILLSHTSRITYRDFYTWENRARAHIQELTTHLEAVRAHLLSLHPKGFPHD